MWYLKLYYIPSKAFLWSASKSSHEVNKYRQHKFHITLHGKVIKIARYFSSLFRLPTHTHNSSIHRVWIYCNVNFIIGIGHRETKVTNVSTRNVPQSFRKSSGPKELRNIEVNDNRCPSSPNSHCHIYHAHLTK